MENFLVTEEKTFLRLYHKALGGQTLTIQEKRQASTSLATALVACHEPVTKQLRRYTHSPQDAEDIVSDATIRLFETVLVQIGFTSSQTKRPNNFVIKTVLSAVKALIGKPFYGKKIGLLFSYYWKKSKQSQI